MKAVFFFMIAICIAAGGFYAWRWILPKKEKKAARKVLRRVIISLLLATLVLGVILAIQSSTSIVLF